jgi:hypothetical protein
MRQSRRWRGPPACPAQATGPVRGMRSTFTQLAHAHGTVLPPQRHECPSMVSGRPSKHPTGLSLRPCFPSKRPTGCSLHPCFPSQRPTGCSLRPCFPSLRPCFPSQRPTGLSLRPCFPSQHPTGCSLHPWVRSAAREGGVSLWGFALLSWFLAASLPAGSRRAPATRPLPPHPSRLHDGSSRPNTSKFQEPIFL